MTTINRIYDPEAIRIAYYDDYGVEYPQPPEDAEVIDAPYTYDEAMTALRTERDRRSCCVTGHSFPTCHSVRAKSCNGAHTAKPCATHRKRCKHKAGTVR